MARLKPRFGWKPDKKDPRDLKFKLPQHFTAFDLPERVDNTRFLPKEVLHQLDLGSCTANAADTLLRSAGQRVNKPVAPTSRLYTYFNTRDIEGTTDEDAGGEIRNVFKALNKNGYCDEPLWPYKIKSYRKRPPEAAYAQGAARTSGFRYGRVAHTPEQLQASLHLGYLVEFGFFVPASFISPFTEDTGIMTMPRPGESVLGGHAVVLVDYDRKLQRYRCRNSYGSEWGDRGYFYMPFAFAHDPDWCLDHWTILEL